MEFTNYCSTRKFFFLYNVPPTRLNIVSPYGSYTQHDLDMRRKAEILKYNTSTTQGTITRSQKWRRIVNTSVNPSSTTSTILNCPLDDLIETPTSSCDVPGPVILLYNDPNIPLYNYKLNTDAYSLLETPTNTDLFEIDGIIKNEIYIDETFLCVLKIFDITSSITTFEIVIPMTLITNPGGISINISIDIPDLIVRYTNIPNNLYQANSSSANFYDLNNNVITPPFNSTSNEYHFLIKYSNITLPTASGYIYSLLLAYAAPRVTTVSTNYSVSFVINSDTHPMSMYMGIAPLTDAVSNV